MTASSPEYRRVQKTAPPRETSTFAMIGQHQPMREARRLQAGLLVLLLFILSVTPSAATQEIRFERGQSANDVRMAFKLEVLRLAMEKTREQYGDYTITTKAPMLNTTRALSALRSGELINVYIALTNAEWERAAIPIRIPIRMGLLSYRLLLVHQASLPRFQEVRGIEDLRKLRGGSLQSWTTTRILELAELPIVKVSTYEGIFPMLDTSRFDYIPRGVHEIFAEFEQHHRTLPHIAIEPTLLLYIPTPSYVFVSPRSPLLADRLQAGLELMVQDGTLAQVVERYFADAIAKAKLSSRRVITIPNPLLPEATPLERAELWFTPRFIANGAEPAVLEEGGE